MPVASLCQGCNKNANCADLIQFSISAPSCAKTMKFAKIASRCAEMPDQLQNFLSCANFSEKWRPRSEPVVCVISQYRDVGTQTLLQRRDRPDKVTTSAPWFDDHSRFLSVDRCNFKAKMHCQSQQHFVGNNFLVSKCGLCHVRN